MVFNSSTHNIITDENKHKSGFAYVSSTNNILFIGIMSTLLAFLCLCIFCVTPYFCFKLRKLRKLQKRKCQQFDNSSGGSNVDPSPTLMSVCGSIQFQSEKETNLSTNRSPSPSPFVAITRIPKNSNNIAIVQDFHDNQSTDSTIPNALALSQLTGTCPFTDYYDECHRNSLSTSECDIVQRMISVICKFQRCTIQKNSTLTSDEICNLIFKSKDNGHEHNDYYLFIKNDYNHILQSHDDNQSFYYIYCNICNDEEICNILCGIKHCNDQYNQHNHCLIVSLFDELHSYFIHSYDTGMRLKPAIETDTVYNESLQIHIPESRKYQSDIDNNDDESDGLDEYKSREMHRFASQLLDDNDGDDVVVPHIIDELPDINYNHIGTAIDGVYAFGVRFLYWEKYKLSKYYVFPKFTGGLKEELLDPEKNELFKLIDWQSVYEKSIIYLDSYHGRHLVCNKSPLVNDYKINPNQSLSIFHMISLVIYCNFDKLQFFMKESFRKIRKNESLLSVKTRNGSYANWSKLLRESVEIYGKLMRDNKEMKFYHGVVGEFVFPTTVTKFCAPTSFSASLRVAMSVSVSKGIIVELEMYDLDVAYFDCRYISHHSNQQQEHIVCGGYQCFIITNVILIRLQHNYKQYLDAINIIISVVSGRFIAHKIPQQTIQIINALINYCMISTKAIANPFKIPQYVLKLFNCIRINWNKEIKISLSQLRDKNYSQIFVDDGDEKWVDLDIITKVFVSCTTIVICGKYGTDGILLSNKTLDKLFLFLSNLSSKLNQIIFETPNLNGQNVELKYKLKFEKLNFRINYQQTNNEGISSISITKTDINETIQ